MSGHSKWSTIKRAKGVTDARRSLVFTKYARIITVAVREGGKDPDMNFKLRLAIDKAKSVNMPNDNIERAIKSGAGELKGEQTKEVLYEGFGPGGVAVMAQTITDNTNRTAGDLRGIFQKFGGSMGGQNSVAWMFQMRGVIRLPLAALKEKSVDAVELGVIDAGAEDVNINDDQLTILTAPDKGKVVEQWLADQGIAGAPTVTELWPQTTVTIDEPIRQQLYRLLEALEDQPDVTDVYTNDA